MQYFSWIAPAALLAIIVSLEVAALYFSARTFKFYMYFCVIIVVLIVLEPRAWLPIGRKSQCAQIATTDSLLRCKATSTIQSITEILLGRDNITVGTVSWIFVAIALVLLYRQLRILNGRNDIPIIEVGDFPDVTPEYSQVPNRVSNGYVEAQLRAILSRSLVAHAQIPGPRVPLTTSALLQGVSTLDSSTFGRLIAFALNWISPKRRWRIEGATLGAVSGHPCGLYVDLLDLRTERSIVAEIFWAVDWEAAIEEVGYYVISTALRQARTDLSYLRWRDPYGRGLRTYHQWQRTASELNFDEQIKLLTEASGLEPANIVPRLEIAYCYERLASNEEQAAQSTQPRDPIMRQSYAHRLQACAIYAMLSTSYPRLLQARYRLAVTLGNVDRWKAGIQACPTEWKNLARNLAAYLENRPLRDRIRYSVRARLGTDGIRYDVRRCLANYLTRKGYQALSQDRINKVHGSNRDGITEYSLDELIDLLRLVGKYERLAILRDCSIPILAMWCIRMPYRRLYGSWLLPLSAQRRRATAAVQTSLAVVEAGRIWRVADGNPSTITSIMANRRRLLRRIRFALRRGRHSGLPAYNIACFYAYLIGRPPQAKIGKKANSAFGDWAAVTLPWAREAVKYLDLALRNPQESFLPWEWVDVVDTDFERLRHHEYYLHWRTQMTVPVGTTFALYHGGEPF